MRLRRPSGDVYLAGSSTYPEGTSVAQEPGSEGASKAVVSVLSALAGVLGGALAAGMWLGTVRAELTTHVQDGSVHLTKSQKEEIARQVVDREVKPLLEDIRERLRRIENKVDAK